MKTENVEELCALETQLDSHDAVELAKLRCELTERMLNDLIDNKERLASDLRQEGKIRLCYCISFHTFYY